MSFDKNTLLLYAVTDRSWLGEKTLCQQVEESLKGGVTMIQLREKKLDKESFFKEALEIKKLCKSYNVPFIINDNVELAIETDADGVHVGQEDMRASEARKMLGPDKIVGVSAHNAKEALEAQAAGADYLGLGAVFPTSTKDDVDVLDRETLKNICLSVAIPCVAIGGIKSDNILELSGCGLAGVSVVSAIYAQVDIQSASRNLKKLSEQMVNL